MLWSRPVFNHTHLVRRHHCFKHWVVLKEKRIAPVLTLNEDNSLQQQQTFLESINVLTKGFQQTRRDSRPWQRSVIQRGFFRLITHVQNCSSSSSSNGSQNQVWISQKRPCNVRYLNQHDRLRMESFQTVQCFAVPSTVVHVNFAAFFFRSANENTIILCWRPELDRKRPR